MVRSFEAESREAQPLSSANKSRGQPHVIPPDFHAPGPPTPRPLPSDGPRRPGVVRRLSVTWSTLVLAGDVAREGGGGGGAVTAGHVDKISASFRAKSAGAACGSRHRAGDGIRAGRLGQVSQRGRVA